VFINQTLFVCLSLCEAPLGISTAVSLEPSGSSSSSSSSDRSPAVAPITPPLEELVDDFKEARSKPAVATHVASNKSSLTRASSTVVDKKPETARVHPPAKQFKPKPRATLIPKAKAAAVWVAKAKARRHSFTCK
jgi:hypothetical protein